MITYITKSNNIKIIIILCQKYALNLIGKEPIYKDINYHMYVTFEMTIHASIFFSFFLVFKKRN